ncbi:MAG: MarC family protein [Cellvibrionales bacterium]|nr:MarC family protein [Cellvibrionales bacterium]
MSDTLATFVFFFAVIDPIGTVPVFIAVTSHYGERTKRRIAVKATFMAMVVLLFFVVAGELVLTSVNVPIEAFQVAGGIVLFLFAMSMIFGEPKPEEEMKMACDGSATAIFPLAVPSIASPGAMLAAVLMTNNSKFNIIEQVQTTLIILSVLAIVFIFMLIAGFIYRIIGQNGASIISRVMGIILASVAVTSVLNGIKDYFAI